MQRIQVIIVIRRLQKLIIMIHFMNRNIGEMLLIKIYQSCSLQDMKH